MRYGVHWHGQKLTVCLTNEAVKVTADGKNSGEISLTLCSQEQKLLPGQEICKKSI